MSAPENCVVWKNSVGHTPAIWYCSSGSIGMIIGHGDIAKALQGMDRDDRIYFASGVSNSQETKESEYQMEADLLFNQDRSKHLIYFSSLCIFYSDNRYAHHKKDMENFVKWWFPKHTILRMGNITWGKNPHTLINFIRNRIRNRESIEIQDVYRYVLEKDEFIHWIGLIPDFSCEMNIVGKRMKVKEIVKQYCYPWGTSNEPGERDHSEQKLRLSC